MFYVHRLVFLQPDSHIYTLLNPPDNMSSGYVQYDPYGYGVAQPVKSGTGLGSSVMIIAGIIAAGILIGMALGLGLGIGTAGLDTSTNLTFVTNTTNSSA